MNAVINNGYGSVDVLQYTSIEKPTPKPNQLLVKVHGTSVNPIDWKIRKGLLKLFTGNKFPMILGFDISGDVVEVGSAVTRFHPGEPIYAYLDSFPGGAYAEYAVVSEQAACLKPNNMTPIQAAAVPLAALTALQGLRNQGKIQPGHQVLINGSSGGVGSFAVQIAKALAAQVTAVCSTKNVELVKSLGADRVIDYTIQDVTQDTAKYDIVFNTVAHQTFSRWQKMLKPRGVYVTTLPTVESVVQTLFTSIFPGKTAKLIRVKPSGKDLTFLKELIEANKIQSVIEETYPLSDVAQAHSISEQGHVVGKLVIRVTPVSDRQM
ncbi:MAG: NAD(P)-dependent alcohol dehydrogenase [Coleofasciculus sp. C1-SOL-03]|uniref:NAD(P)-dependent alcohol dehydrogenase n=1 Tax=Coleofasciculus sp. C1-SOL-03 TaxID=3069522 RepID=UPI00330501C5